MAPNDLTRPTSVNRFFEKGALALWLGNFANEDELFTYLEGDFGAQFGILFDESIPMEFEVVPSKVPIRKLLQGFSAWQSFIDRAESEANSKGWLTATTAMILYAVRFPEDVSSKVTVTALEFIGNFAFSIQS